MKIINYLKSKINESTFNATIPWGLVGPFFITRKNLFNSIKEHSHYICGRIIDIGCGSKPYKALFTYSDYIGIDISNPSHSHQNEDVDVFYNGYTIPFEEQSFDSCFSSEVFEHVFNLDRTLQEINRILKTGGHILITTPFIWDEHEAPYDYCRYTSFGLKDVFQRNGFEVIRQEKVGSFLEIQVQLILIYLNRKLGTSKFLKYFFFLVICPILNLLGVLPFRSSMNRTLYISNIVVAKKL